MLNPSPRSLEHLGDPETRATDHAWRDAARGGTISRRPIAHPNVLRIVALSGGRQQAEADARPPGNTGDRESPGLRRRVLEVQQSDAEFDAALRASIDSIFAARDVVVNSGRQP